MSQVQFTDELVREYLLFRGFGGALKAFDSDLKLDKDKGFRVDKIVDQILQCICNYDLTGLKEIWNHMESRLFTRLEQHFTLSIRKLENGILKFYLMNASENNRPDKITEFFNKHTSEIINQIEWKDWFVFPFVKNPEEHSVFGVYFTRQWQETLIVSLHNFLAAIYQCMPQPTLSNFEENASKMAALQKENDIIRKGLINMLNDQDKGTNYEANLVQDFGNIMDDFFNISQEIKKNENQTKMLKTIMRNIGSVPPSPKSEGKDQIRNSHRKLSTKKVAQTKRSLSIEARPAHLKPRERDSSLDLITARTNRENFQKKEEGGGERVQEGNFLFLSREEFSEHSSAVTAVKFNNRGNLVASSDKEGNLKVWSMSPACKTVAAFSNKHTIVCLDWVPSHERYVICGNSNASVDLYDIKEVKAMWSVTIEAENVSNKKVEDIACSPVDPMAIAIMSGKLFILDLKTRKIEKSLKINGGATCVEMNHNGQLVLIGTQEGAVSLLDLRKNEIIETWIHHRFPVTQMEITSDYTFVYTLAHDKLYCKSLNQSKSKGLSISIPEEMKIHPELHGRLFCLDNTGGLILTVGVNSGVIYKVSDGSLVKSLELGGHKTMLTCVDWSFANQCATCVTASQDGKIEISTLLINSV